MILHVDAHWLRHYAGDFLAAAQAFESPANRFSPVPCYLLGHSIELSLKAFLFTVGFNRSDRKKLNHDLELALRLAEDEGLGAHLEITLDDREVLRGASRLYSKKEFEYFESLETVYDPLDFDPQALASFATRLFDAIEGPVSDSVVE